MHYEAAYILIFIWMLWVRRLSSFPSVNYGKCLGPLVSILFWNLFSLKEIRYFDKSFLSNTLVIKPSSHLNEAVPDTSPRHCLVRAWTRFSGVPKGGAAAYTGFWQWWNPVCRLNTLLNECAAFECRPDLRLGRVPSWYNSIRYKLWYLQHIPNTFFTFA